MTGCSAKGCTNRPEKGFKMHKFPSDPARRNAWEAKVSGQGPVRVDKHGRPWRASMYAQLCEVHFEENQFELRRADGKRKLKFNAVPMLFGLGKTRRAAKATRVRHRVPVPEPTPAPVPEIALPNPVPHDHAYSCAPPPCSVVKECTSAIVTDRAEAANTAKNGEEQPATPAAPKLNATEARLSRLRERIKGYQTELRKMRKEKERLLSRQSRLESNIGRIFGADQLEALNRGSMRGVKWGADTIDKAAQLWHACGPNGYEFLLKQRYPLPSARTLQRSMVNTDKDGPRYDAVAGPRPVVVFPQVFVPSDPQS